VKHSTGKPTAAQQRRLDALSRMPCIACLLEGAGTVQPNRTEIHHLVDKGTRELSGGHDSTLPLCVWHHRGVPRGKATAREMATAYGPSLALQKRAFNARYGTERELLARVNARLSEKNP
jgi:hypothetical protein